MSLPPYDVEYLESREIDHTITIEEGMVCVIFNNHELPKGFDHPHSDLLLRLTSGYPDIAPDMWWFCPSISRVDGKSIEATDAIEPHLGRQWQRWSRHFNQGQWRSGVDCLETFLALINSEIKKCAVEVR